MELDHDYDHDDQDDRDLCDHYDYEVDILEGRCRCTCGHAWYASNEQLLAEIESQRAYDEWERRHWWSELFYNLRHPLEALHWQLQKRGWLRRREAINDDDIPF